ncbi:MAG: hypothetical protein LBB66_01500 [Desulfovibrio sp.]|nr:hypothetical protein [Desulfovibrio sp.]
MVGKDKIQNFIFQNKPGADGFAATASAAADINKTAYNGDVAQIGALLAKGARMDIKAHDGKTVYDKARAEGKSGRWTRLPLVGNTRR